MPLASAPVARTLLRDHAYDRLEAAIIDGSLRPGERLRDDDLAQSLGMSRTPLREALARLGEAGLVETKANRFTRVSLLDEADARAIFPIAAALQALVAELAVASHNAADVAELRSQSELFTWANWRNDVDQALAADRALHAILERATCNAQLLQLLATVMPRVRRFERVAWTGHGERPGSAEHERVVIAVESRDGRAAAAGARLEWTAVGEAVEVALRRSIGR
jgi:DNA-binding GntR family transcriptional regulator